MALPTFDPKKQMLQCFLCATVVPERLANLEARLQILAHNPLQAASGFDYIEHVYEADRASKNLRTVRVRLEQHTNGLWDLVYVGRASHRGDDITSQRGLCRIGLQEDGHALCLSLGMSKQATLRRVGQAYTSDDIVLTTVTRIYEVKDDGSQELLSPDYYVEVSATGPSTGKLELAKAVYAFAGALYPEVQLQRLDPVT